MAFPIIPVDSNSGSDTCSNASIRGISASTDGTGLIVTLDGSPDLSGVATDGSAWIQLLDATAGARNFGKIIAVDNTAKTVTVSDAFGLSLSGLTWAINQTLASLSHANSTKLFSNNSAAGDAMPGWRTEYQSGHTETHAAAYLLRRSGDATDGLIVVGTVAGAAVRPIITFTNNGNGFEVPGTSFIELNGFDLQNTNATKTASRGVWCGSSSGVICKRIRVAHSTNCFNRGFGTNSTASSDMVVYDCEAAYCVGAGISTVQIADGCYSHDNGGEGIIISSNSVSHSPVQNNIVVNNTGDGVRILAMSWLRHNVIHGNGGDGVDYNGTTAALLSKVLIENNIITDNGAYGINFSGGVSDILVRAANVLLRNNNFGTGGTANTSGAFTSNLAGVESDNVYLDPEFVNAAGGDYSVGTNMKAIGAPDTVIGFSATRSYVDIGAAQREEQGSGGLLVHPGMAGGFRA